MDEQPSRKLRKFLAVFLLPSPQAEHARLVEAIAYHSDGDYKLAFRQGMKDGAVVGYLFTSASKAQEMGFGQVLLNEDSYLITELGENYAVEGHNVAEAWLRSKRATRTEG